MATDPIHVTRAVRRCPMMQQTDSIGGQSVHIHPCSTCDDTDWVDVPVDEECEWCLGLGQVNIGWNARARAYAFDDCLDCGGSGRRLHNWATGWCVGDEVLTTDGYSSAVLARVASFDIDGIWETLDVGDHGSYVSDPSEWTLVLSDPSHRPAPMRWKQ